MKRYLFLGDTHGDIDFAGRAADYAAEHDAEIIQLGDWGFIWKKSNQVQALSTELARAGEREGKPPVVMRFIDGNHDHHPELARLTGGCDTGFPLASNVIYQPRGSRYVDEDGTRFLFLGGAPSIDKWARTEGVSWWKEETITEADVERALAGGPCDVLVTHDAPDYPPGFGPKGDPAFLRLSVQSMNDIARVIRETKPTLHVHGHWHHYYVSGVTRGLDCNYGRFIDSTFLWSRE